MGRYNILKIECFVPSRLKQFTLMRNTDAVLKRIIVIHVHFDQLTDCFCYWRDGVFVKLYFFVKINEKRIFIQSFLTLNVKQRCKIFIYNDKLQRHLRYFSTQY